MVGAIVGSTKREPIVVGKPSDFMLKNISASLGLRPDQIAMVGDRLDTDIMFGKNGGLTTGLVLSGGCAGGRAQPAARVCLPTYTCTCMHESACHMSGMCVRVCTCMCAWGTARTGSQAPIRKQAAGP